MALGALSGGEGQRETADTALSGVRQAGHRARQAAHRQVIRIGWLELPALSTVHPPAECQGNSGVRPTLVIITQNPRARDWLFWAPRSKGQAVDREANIRRYARRRPFLAGMAFFGVLLWDACYGAADAAAGAFGRVWLRRSRKTCSVIILMPRVRAVAALPDWE